MRAASGKSTEGGAVDQVLGAVRPQRPGTSELTPLSSTNQQQIEGWQMDPVGPY
jgi:hypothetical protein